MILVTGGSNGIGKQIAIEMLIQDASVIICSTQPSDLEKTKYECAVFGLGVEAILCDVRDNNQVNKLADRVLSKYGHVDILINNAGYATYRSFEESSLHEILDLVDVNLCGAMRCTKIFLPSMISRRSGRIVNISSIGGETIITPNATYCAAKHGMVAWTKAIRYELAHFNIKANVICPGHTKTNFHDHSTFRRRDPYRKNAARSLSVKDVSTKVIKAIRKDCVVTYVPAWYGLVVWALNAIPFVALPVWNKIAHQRVVELYEQIELEHQKCV